MNAKLLWIDSYLALVVALINFVYGTFALARTSRTALYNVFVLMCLSNIVWNFSDFMIYLNEARWWYYFEQAGSSMLPALMFHLIFMLVMPKGKRMIWVLLAYLLSGLFALGSLSAIFFSESQRFMEGSVSSILFLTLLGPFLFAGIIMVLKALKEAKDRDEKQWLRYVSAWVIIGVSTGLTDVVGFVYRPVPPLSHLGCLIYSSVLAIGVFKRRAAYDIVAQMQKKLEDLSQIAAGIAHEIRNPMTSIKGASSLLGKEWKSFNHPKGEEYFELIGEEIERIDKILGGFQYFTKPLTIEKDLVSINNVIQKTAKLAEVGALSLGIRLDLCPDLPMVKADPSLMKQVFLNLIKNSAEACQTGGQLLIKTEHIPSFVKISFSDNGPGIPLKLRDHIFEPFFTTKPTGMGIGLSISQRIVQAHDGRIEINNLFPQGAQVSIFLPV